MKTYPTTDTGTALSQCATDINAVLHALNGDQDYHEHAGLFDQVIRLAEIVRFLGAVTAAQQKEIETLLAWQRQVDRALWYSPDSSHPTSEMEE